MIHEALPHAPSLVHRQGDLGDEVDGMKGDTIKFLSDDDGNRKRGAPCGYLARHISQGLFFSSCLFSNLSDGEASFRSLDDNGDGANCASSFDETVQVLGHAGADGALERSCAFFCFCWGEELWFL